MKKNRHLNAYKSHLNLRNNPIQAARDMHYISCQLDVEKTIIGKINYYVTPFIQLIMIPRVRRASFASFTVMIA